MNWKEYPKEDIYLCFSFPLYKFLTDNEVYPICKDTHKKTNRVFSVFVKGDKLQKLLKQWTENRPIKEEDEDEGEN